jgi:hypothetical protein
MIMETMGGSVCEAVAIIFSKTTPSRANASQFGVVLRAYP